MSKVGNKIGGKITRVGIVDSSLFGGIQFMLQGNNIIFIVESTSVTDKIFLSKIGDSVEFEKINNEFFYTSTFNVKKSSFVNLTLQEETINTSDAK